MIWSIQNPLRSKQERDALEELVSRASWLLPLEWRIDGSLRLIWDADIVVGDRSFPISLRYPNHFPHSPPVVIPRGQTERWSSHQYGAGGELCLEYGPDNWRPEITGADMIESAHRLLAGERPNPQETGVVATRHATTLGQNLSGVTMRILVTRNLATAIELFADNLICEGVITCTWRSRSVVYTVRSIDLPSNEKWEDASVPQTISDEGYDQPVAIFRWPEGKQLPSLKSLADFQASLTEAGIIIPDVKYAVLAQGTSYHGYLLWKDDDTATRIPVIPPQQARARVDESHSALASRSVALIGCGSLGSKIASIMARSGVGKFLLVDDDIMLPDNVIRHDLDWREIGRHKVDGVSRRIRLINPLAVRETRRYRLGGQQSSGSIETLIEKLAEYDLVIDASADSNVFTYLCAVAAVGKKAVLWAQVFGGGFGGLIARHRHGLEPDPATMRAQIEQWCIEQGKPFERTAGNYEGSADGPLMIADDADVSVIASHAARLAIDTLITRGPSMFPNSVYMIGLAEGWVFEQPFDTRPIDVGSPLPQENELIDESLMKAETARILQLFKNYSNASDTDTTSTSTASE